MGAAARQSGNTEETGSLFAPNIDGSQKQPRQNARGVACSRLGRVTTQRVRARSMIHDMEKKLERWKLLLSELTFDVVHCAGIKNKR